MYKPSSKGFENSLQIRGLLLAILKLASYVLFRCAQPKVTNFPFYTISNRKSTQKCSHFERGPRNLIISLFDRAFIMYTTYNTTLQPSAIRTCMLSVQFSNFTD